ncbi:MAG TPA: membrane protein insertase YidC [Bdellovibrionales bacterium]|nr:membrane protein insertase YidC [Bdellovibrionales bacterium]
MNNDDQKSFLDGRTFIAVILMLGVWIGWQSYLTKKYPAPAKPAATATNATDVGAPAQTPNSPNESSVAAAPKPTAPESASMQEQIIEFKSDTLSFKLSSLGMGLKDITINRFVDRAGHTVRMGASRGVLPFQTNLKGSSQPIAFNLQKISETEFKGVANVDGGTVTKVLRINPETYTITSTIEADGVDGVTTFVSEESKVQDSPGKKLQDDPNNWLSYFVATKGDEEREYPAADVGFANEYQGAVVAAVGSRYFSFAMADSSPTEPLARVVSEPANNVIYGSLTHSMGPGATKLRTETKLFVGPKMLDLMRSVDHRLQKVVDFGMFSWIGFPILDLLKWFYKMFHNYGLAIIALTILVRILVLPFNLMSYKSMKAMQVIQPQIQRLKERYKDDREALNREMMVLMRDNKVNPLGGCLPMLLQLPVFIALYQVLNETIELYRAPFGLWIYDLSLKDPYYVLPVLMGITMFIQQKMTPTTMDPAQAKVMLFMPVMFTFLMISLPSGLTLYIFVSTLFGIIQQLVFMREKKVGTGSKVVMEGS